MASDKKEKKVKLPSMAFLICLIIAFGVWLAINLSKEYTLSVNYQVVCDDLPENKTIASWSDSLFVLTFHTRGINYLNAKFSDRNRVLHLSVNNLTVNSTKRNVYTFNRKTLEDYIRTLPGFQTGFVQIESPESLTIYLK